MRSHTPSLGTYGLRCHLPVTVDMQHPSKGRDLLGADIEQLRVWPRPVEEDGPWRAAREVHGVPWLRDEVDLDLWLRTVPAGSIAGYWLGNLAIDRATRPRLDLLAMAVALRSPSETARITSCGHVRGYFVGSGDLIPLARRIGDDERLYLVKRTTPPSPGRVH